MIESVVFDMDGVLFDTERISSEAWAKVGTEMKIPDFNETKKSCIGRNAADAKRLFAERYGEAFPYGEFRKRVNLIFNAVLEKGLPVKTGVYELLGFLRDNSCKIALATSTSRESTMRHLEAAHIKDYFEAVITGDMIKHGKPDPEIYKTACERLRVRPENAFAIEDSPNGIRSAYAAGMKPIMVPDLIAPTEEIEKLLFAKFDSLLEVKNYLSCNF